MSEPWDGHGYTATPKEETVVAKTLDPSPWKCSHGDRGPRPGMFFDGKCTVTFAPGDSFEQDQSKYATASVVSPEPEQPNARETFDQLTVTMARVRDAFDASAAKVHSDALPTEPGVYSQPYVDFRESDDWKTDIALFMLNAAGNWIDVGWGNDPDLSDGPVTRLVPASLVVDAKKEVIDWFEDELDWERPEVFDLAREHFGLEER